MSVNGSGFAGEPLEIVCESQSIEDIVRPPSVRIVDPLGIEVAGETSGGGVVEHFVLLDPLLTSHAGVFTCVSTYNIPEAGLDNDSTSESVNVTVSSKADHGGYTEFV